MRCLFSSNLMQKAFLMLQKVSNDRIEVGEPFSPKISLQKLDTDFERRIQFLENWKKDGCAIMLDAAIMLNSR